jgi:hypothetical protein
MREKSARLMAFLGAAICLTAVGLQLALIIGRFHEHGATTIAGLWRFLSFFTNLTNILAALVLAHAALRPTLRIGLAEPRVEAATTTAILMAGILNSALLAGRLHPQGLYWLADFALHVVAPAAVAMFWVLRPHGSLRVKDAFFAMGWPLLYCLYALARGAADGWYPYYFLDPAILGLGGLAASIVGLGLAFLAAALLLVVIDRRLAGGFRGIPGRGFAAVPLAPVPLAPVPLAPLPLAPTPFASAQPAAAFAGLDESDRVSDS